MTSIESQWNLDPNLIYLNHAAVSPWPACTVNAVQRFAEENARVGSLHYPRWLKTEAELREKCCRLINANHTDDIALLKNTSEGLSIIAYGLDWNHGDNIVSSDEEFPSNRIIWESLKNRGVDFKQVNLLSSESPEQALINAIDQHTRLLSISSVQYATGLKIDLNTLGKYCRENNIIFVVDAIQSIGAHTIDVQACMADFVIADGHKWMMAAEGLALFYCSPQAKDRLKLNQFGWHMVEQMGDFDNKNWQIAKSARRFECGSPNMLGVHALNASLGLIEQVGMEKIESKIKQNSEFLFEEINNNHKLNLVTNTDANRYAGIVSFFPQKIESKVLFEHLTQQGVFAALRGGNIRFSPHYYTPRDRLKQAIELIKKFT
ncbi:MAG: aminotransferase class V-fold PLP-dependent enzyme [Gammaproteobacteria bacterium]|nr:aminotransferase class V-fold PLP-dependent enzyme [Gammaproteobacteria bacterium]MDH5729125.1 aminotransferase class V-fold PLP-dependent enzyme [Gammaproteobacteria bacterium]